MLTPRWGKEKRGDLSRQTKNECLLHVKAMRYFNKTKRDRKWRVSNDWGSEMKEDSVVGWIWDVPRRLMSLNTGPHIGTLSWEVIVGSKRWILEGYNPDILLGLSVFFTLTWRDQSPHTSITQTQAQCHAFPVMMGSSFWTASQNKPIFSSCFYWVFILTW